MKFLISFLLILGCFSHNALCQRPLPSVYFPSSPLNYIRIWESRRPEKKDSVLNTWPLKDVLQTTQYADGLGRIIQTVVKKGSYATDGAAADLVSPVVYDASGREEKKYLPFAASALGGNASVSDGGFKYNSFQQQDTFAKIQYPGETYFYSETDFEPSPLNRILKTTAPGNSWAGSGRGVAVKNLLNTAIDSVQIWSVSDSAGRFGSYNTTGMYRAGKLYKTITEDEHGKQVIEFKDMAGLVILKKVQLTAVADTGLGKNYSGWLCTYYVYDDLNNLRCVIQPNAVKSMTDNNTRTLSGTQLDEQCFRYGYDSLNRMILKKVPGAGEVQMIYDKRDRLVMTQDGNLKSAHQWLYTKYDSLNRQVQTGIITDNGNYNNPAYHRNLSKGSISYPSLGSYSGGDTLTNTYYDNYDWLSGAGNPFTSSYNTIYDTYFETPSNSTWPYPQANTQASQTAGFVTGVRTRIPGSNDFLYSISYYDAKGRTIQTESKNITGATDINTTQYSWAGQPLISVQNHEITGSNAQTTVVVTKLTYDSLTRLVKTEKKLSNTNVDSDAMSDYKTISVNEYDKLGQLVKKNTGNKPGQTAGTALAKMNYKYNIRGWLLSVNEDYVKGGSDDDNYFGMSLGYDKKPAGTDTTTAAQYNGNINASAWRSAGDGERRKYDYNYDAVNRLMKGDFKQLTGSTWNTGAGADFSMKMGNGTDAVTAYDANGNILGMTQKGLKINTSSIIDRLNYNYFSGSNRLSKVTDSITGAENGRLGDFKDAGNSTDDYAYDVNGNMISDSNKKISAVVYNHLNLPSLIRIPGKGTIRYLYDATGNKLLKTVTDSTVSPPEITKTAYHGGAVYRNDTLQFIAHEEGRTRYKPATGSTGASFEYDYFLKDHLGNVRAVITEEQRQDIYPAATLETAKLVTEKNYYSIDDNLISDMSIVTGLPEYTNGSNGIGNNPPDAVFEGANSEKLYRLNGNDGFSQTGLGITLRVMAGDRIDIFGKSYHKEGNSGGSGANIAVPLTAILNGLLGNGAAGAVTNVHGPVTVNDINTTATVGGINAMLNSQNNETDANDMVPKAYINYLFFDEQLRCTGGGYSRSGNGLSIKDHHTELQNLAVPKNGYVYIYCSNESPMDVFFDNVQVVHTRGQLLEEMHYYPFGLTMAGISSRAASIIPNKEKTFQGQQFDDDLGINYVEFRYRNHDLQIGRFIEIDPLADDYVYNSTYAFSENKVTSHVELEGLESVPINPINPGLSFIANKIIEWKSDVEGGRDNFLRGAAEKQAVNEGAYSDQPQFAQDFHALDADLSMNAGIAGMVKPGLEAANIVGGIVVGLEIPAGAGLFQASTVGLKGAVSFGEHVTLGGITNPVSSEVSRVIPNSLNGATTLGRTGAQDVFVTAASDIKGMNASQISRSLTIPQSSSGYKVITFPTPEGIASPINRTNPGFTGFGRTAGGAREYVVPNGPIPKNALIKIIK